jgi:predicted ATP-grasp superfamily ATP-dependent carboligase
MNILVLDANQRAGLAATRSLGRAGYVVTTADDRARTLAGASRWSRAAVVYPSPLASPDAFIEWARITLNEGGFHAALPITEITTDLLVRHRDLWPDVVLPFADIETIDALSNKVALYERALSLNVPVPRSVVVQNDVDVDHAIAQIGFPAILKPARSRIRRGTDFLPTSVRRVADEAGLRAALRTPEFCKPFLYQKLVDGEGRGIFALYDRGEPVAYFAHRRLREKPPAGGVSVYCESCSPDPELQQLSERLLCSANWHGVAMVEFKGRYLMEVNARFWGSLQLAIDANVDFPRLLVDRAFGRPQGHGSPYRSGRRLRWYLGDLDRLYLVWKMSGAQPSAADGLSFCKEALRFVIPDPGRTRHEVFRWSDPKPALAELQEYVRALRDQDQGTPRPAGAEH